MDNTTVSHVMQDPIVSKFEQAAAEIASKYQAQLRELTKAQRRERYIEWHEYYDDSGAAWDIVTANYALRGCEPSTSISSEEENEIVGRHFDNLTETEKAAFDKMYRNNRPDDYIADYYRDELIAIREGWNRAVRELESPEAKHSTETFVIKAKHSPGTFHCLTCGAFSYSHDEAGELIAMPGLWPMTDGSFGNYIVCECCASKLQDTYNDLAKYFAECEAFRLREEERRDSELSKNLADSGIDPDTGIYSDPNNPQLHGAHMPKSQKLLNALAGLGYTFSLNRLEDNVEVNGQRLDDVTLSDINLKLVDDGYSRPNIADAINVLASRNSYDPIIDYLCSLQWDGKNHLAELLRHFTGDGTMIHYDTQSLPLHGVLIGRWLTGAVARGLNRGNNVFNHQTPMLVVIGPQGIGKSSWARWLTSGIGYEFHRESMINPHGTEDIRSMVTKWIWEVSELGSSLRRGDRDSLKAFITQEWHTYRKPWAKTAITKPTLCNFIGTLNPETGFLDDPTGHRRFLPVVINAIDHRYKNIDVNQVWAEVVHRYRTGQTTPELNQAEREALSKVYKQHEVENPLETYINMYFDIAPGNTGMRTHTAVIIQRLEEFGVRLPSDAKVAGRKINDVLAPMGLTSDQFRAGGVKGRGWIGIQPNAKAPPTYNGFNYP